MCARYDVLRSPEELARELAATLVGEVPARHTIAPTDLAPVLARQPFLALGAMRFGWPGTEPRARVQVNVRCETAARAPRSRSAVGGRRCLVPMHAFHEWSGEKRARVHHLLAESHGALVTAAGLFEVAHDVGGKRPSFVVLTTEATGIVRDVHGRMPLFVPPELREAWLAPDVDPVALIERVRAAGAPPMIERPPPPRAPTR